MPDLHPDIDEYLDSIDYNIFVTSKNLNELIAKVRASTGLPEESCKIIVKEFFQQIRNELLKGNIVHLKEIGRLFIASPKNKTKKKIFVKFNISKKLKNKINE